MMQQRAMVLGAERPCRTTMKEFFESNGVTVNFAEDLRSAKWLVGAVPFDVIFVDESHLDAVAEVSRRQTSARIIVLTEAGADTPRADGVLLKPISATRLEDMLQRTVETLGEASTLERRWETAGTSRISADRRSG